MNEIKNRANQHVLGVEKRMDTLSELIEFKNSLLIPGVDCRRRINDDISIGVLTSNVPYKNRNNQSPMDFHTVRLEQDLGITGLQETFRAMILHDVEKRIVEVEKELIEMIGEKKQ